jgi:hypothetical protein
MMQRPLFDETSRSHDLGQLRSVGPALGFCPIFAQGPLDAAHGFSPAFPISVPTVTRSPGHQVPKVRLGLNASSRPSVAFVRRIDKHRQEARASVNVKRGGVYIVTIGHFLHFNTSFARFSALQLYFGSRSFLNRHLHHHGNIISHAALPPEAPGPYIDLPIEMMWMSTNGLSVLSTLTFSISWITSNPDNARPKMLSSAVSIYGKWEKSPPERRTCVSYRAKA